MAGAERGGVPLGRALAQFRLRAGLARKDMGVRTGFPVSYFAKVEGGHRTPSVATLVRICDAMGVEAWRVLRRAQCMAERGEVKR